MSVVINGTNGVTYNDGSLQSSAPTVGKNRIINGDMRIHQRGGTITMSTGNYNLDRFFSYTSTDGAQTAEQSTETPVGFKNSLKVTTTTADASIAAGQRTSIIHRVEGNNISDLDWGTSDAKTVTLSFWVRSSITGTHGGAVGNGSDNRAYPFTYAISSADTWEKKTITIPGDTTGTWATDNGRSLQIAWGLGVGTTYSGTAGAWESADRNSATGATTGVIGTLNATWFLTGVQLEIGTTASNFENLQFGQQLTLCQRYYEVIVDGSDGIGLQVIGIAGLTYKVDQINMPINFKTEKRANSSTLEFVSGAYYEMRTHTTTVTTSSMGVTGGQTGKQNAVPYFNTSGQTEHQSWTFYVQNSAAHMAFSSEL